MKRRKPQHRIPLFAFDEPYDKPPTKGWWKIWQRRKERTFWKNEINKGELKKWMLKTVK